MTVTSRIRSHGALAAILRICSFALPVLILAAIAPLAIAQKVEAAPTSRSTASASRPANMSWRPVATTVRGLKVAQKTLPGPTEVTVAWLDLTAKDLQVRSFHSGSPKGKEGLLASTQKNGALLAVNTHFFDMETIPTPVLGWEVENGVEKTKPLLSVIRGKKSVAISRSAVWWEEGPTPHFGWVAQEGDARFSLSAPLSGKDPLWSEGGPWPSASKGARRLLRVKEAVGAGPMLVHEGKKTSTRDEERMFEGNDVRHPRTALGCDQSKAALYWVVVDGRHAGSVGMTLAELADFMLGLGASDAMNFDGGGSSTFVLEGKVLNKPLGGTFLRPVPTGLGVFRKAS